MATGQDDEGRHVGQDSRNSRESAVDVDVSVSEEHEQVLGLLPSTSRDEALG